MEVKTRFNIGDTISVIANHKIKDIVVETIEITEKGVNYRDESFNRFAEDECFANRKELCDYILGNTDNEESETNKTKES